jgi:DNA repair exonuclease SbcCD ATPase subunit
MSWIILAVIIVALIIYESEVNGLRPADYLYDIINTIRRHLTLENTLKVEAIIFAIVIIYVVLTNVDPIILLFIGGVMVGSVIIAKIGGVILEYFNSAPAYLEDENMKEVVNVEWEALKRSINATMDRIRKEWEVLREEIKKQIHSEITEVKREAITEFKEETAKAKKEFREEMEELVTKKLRELEVREKAITQREEELRQLKSTVERRLKELNAKMDEVLKKEKELVELLQRAEELAGIGKEYEVLLDTYQELLKKVESLERKERQDIRTLQDDIIRIHSRISRMEEHLIKHRTEHPEEAREVDRAVFETILRENLKLKDKEIEIIQYLLKRGGRNQAGIAKAIGIKAPTAKEYIDHLASLGIVKVEWKGKKKYVKLNRKRLIELGTLPREAKLHIEDEEEEDF